MTPAFNIKTGVRIPELDGFRGLAIFLVVFHHYVYSCRPETSFLAAFIHSVFPLAWSGVDLFFVLSGFLIGGILLDQRHTDHYFQTFYIRRICRTFPAYFLWVILFLMASGLFASRLHLGWQMALLDPQGIPKWAYVFFVQNFYVALYFARTNPFGPGWLGVTWSLAVEEQFYLLLPLLIRWVSPRKLLPVLVSLILLVPVFRLYLYLYHPGILMYVLLPCRADALLLGVLCACIIRNETMRRCLEKHRDKLYAGLVVLLLGAVYLMVCAQGTNSFNFLNSFEIVSWGFSWLAMLYACLMLIVLTAKKGLLVTVMRFGPLRYLGTIAYGVYLIHPTVLILAHGLIFGNISFLNGFPAVIVTCFAFWVTLLLAAVSWHYFEKPIIRRGHSFSYTNKNNPATA